MSKLLALLKIPGILCIRNKVTRLFLVFLIGISTTGYTLSQTTVTGIITDASTGLGIPGASVIVKESPSIGVSTDASGKYSITVPDGQTLVFSFVGMKTQEVLVNRTVIDVALSEDLLNLDEVIVVAYGTAKKSAFTGSAEQINSDKIEARPITNVTQVIEGTSGVQTTSGSGQPGAGPSIRIRGTSSLTLDADPLYVIDGVPFNGYLNSINTSDIETVSILKDAAATALYGNKAANGVVLITTKKGKEGQSQLIVDASTGIVDRSFPEYELVGVEDYYVLMWEAIRNNRMYNSGDTETQANTYASNNLIPNLGYNILNVPDNQVVTNGVYNPDAKIRSGYNDLDWLDPITRTGQRYNYNLSYSGGSSKTDYYVSLGYQNLEGFTINSDFERITARANVNYKALDWFKTGLNVSGTNSTSNMAQEGSSSSYRNPFRTARSIGPIYPVYQHDTTTVNHDIVLDESGNKVYDIYDYRPGGASTGRHIVAETKWNSDIQEITSLSAKTYGIVTFLKDFNFTFNASYDERHFYNSWYDNHIVGDGAPGGRAGRQYTVRNTLNFQELLTYNKEFNFGQFNVLLGHESSEMVYSSFSGDKNTQAVTGNTELDNFVIITDLGSYTDRYNSESYLGRLDYNYNGKYYISGSFRTDASSRFAPEYRWGTFWSVSGAWKLDQELFIKSLNWFDLLKLRASYGQVGNDAGLSYYSYQSLYGLGYNNFNEAGIIRGGKPTDGLVWESLNTFDVSLDFALFGKLQGSVGYYNKATVDMIFDRPLPYSTGYDVQAQNIGKMTNSGVEVDLTWDIIKTQNWKWQVNTNLFTNKNEIVDMPQEEIINGTKKWMEGRSLYDYWLKDYYGVDPDDGRALYVADPEFRDITASDIRVKGTDTLTTNQNKAMYHYCGSAIPDLQGSFTNNLNYKNFDLSFMLTYSIGGYVYDGAHAALMSSGTYGASLSTEILDRWQKPGDKTDIPRMDAGQTSNFNATSDRWLIDASYLNIKQITLGYNLPKKYTDYVKISNARIYASAENVYLFSKRQGMMVSQAFSGVTSNVYPPARIITIGLNVKF